MPNSEAVPTELNLVFRMIRSAEAKDIALTCYREINNYLMLIDRLPKPGRHLRAIIDESVRLCLIRLQKYEKLTGVSAALIALGAFYSNEARRCFDTIPSISAPLDGNEKVSASAGRK
jgi:hypothetical protein